MANVMVEYEEATRSYLNDTIDYDAIDNQTGRRIRRPESTLQQAAEYVSSGETFQKVSTLFNIPISTIRFYMARKGILPRRKRGRTTLNPNSTTGSSYQSDTSLSSFDVSTSITNLNLVNSRSSSPSELPYHLANYKLPEIRPDL